MSEKEIKLLISNGETSKVQFKVNITNANGLAQEMVAFSNSKGGIILVGINDKTWEVVGLQPDDLRRLDTLVSNAAQNNVRSPIVVETDVFTINDKKILQIVVQEGYDKPYSDNDGLIFVKNGSTKRKVTSKEELKRLLQSSGNLYAEEVVLENSTVDDLDWYRFEEFYQNKFKENAEKTDILRILENLRLSKNGKLNLAGALLFTKQPHKTIPAFFVTAIWFAGNDITDTVYRSSENIVGTLAQQYEKAYNFITSKLLYLQNGKSFNSLGDAEVPLIVFQEILTNALIHRDYFIQDTIKIFMFKNRIEIKSPGCLPNSLTEAQIRRGIRKKRNNILDSFAPDVLNYRGIGSGILRALAAYPNIDFINDVEAQQFTVVIHRQAEVL
jgi:ATP-dependent DNA helicase RecG